MADTTEKPAPTDSRQPGFNTEVEESKAAEHAATHAPEPEKPAPKVDPVKERHPFDVLGDLEAYVRSTFGSHPRFEELLAELKQGLGV
jgi:hypothetical protein